MRFAFIQTHARTRQITTMCRALEVSRAGYYAWRVRPLCQRVKTDQILTEQIHGIQTHVKRRYGSPRVQSDLQALGFPAGKYGSRGSRASGAGGVEPRRPTVRRRGPRDLVLGGMYVFCAVQA